MTLPTNGRDALQDFHTASRAKDLAALTDLLAEDVVVRGPGIEREAQGREAATVLLAWFLAASDDLCYEPPIGGPTRVILPFSAQVTSGLVGGSNSTRGAYAMGTDSVGAIAELELLLDPGITHPHADIRG